MDKDNVLLFSLTANPNLAKEVSEALGLPLGNSQVSHFADGEVMARTADNVRNKKIYIIQSTATPVAERLMELLVFIDALKKAKAKEINLVIPYYGFCRQDRIAKRGEPITAKLVATLLETVGISRIITMDLHTPQIQGFFSVPVDDLSPIPLFGQYYRRKLAEIGAKTRDVTVVSPDHGSIHRARDLASELPDSQLAIIDKRRPAPNTAEVVNIVGDVKNRICVMIDDIIDTGGTVLASVEALYAHGAKAVLVGGTHGVFSHDSGKALLGSRIKDLVVTNSIEHDLPGISVISIAPMISKMIEVSEDGGDIPDSWMAFY